MAVQDQLKDVVEDVVGKAQGALGKAQGAVADHTDQINSTIDKVAETVDARTGHKHSETVASLSSKAKDVVEKITTIGATPGGDSTGAPGGAEVPGLAAEPEPTVFGEA